MEESVSETPANMERASRCRSGDDGAVNLKTAGPVSATLIYIAISTTVVHSDRGELPDAVRNDRFVNHISRMLVLRTGLV